MTPELINKITEDYRTWRRQMLDRSVSRVTDGTYRKAPEQKTRDLKVIAHIEEIIDELAKEPAAATPATTSSTSSSPAPGGGATC